MLHIAMLRGASSTELDAAGFDHFLPALGLLAQIGRGCLRRPTDGFRRKALQALPNHGIGKGFVDVDVDFILDNLRRFGACDQPIPGRRRTGSRRGGCADSS